MLDYKPNIVLSTQEYKVVGTNPIRHDGLEKVTGRARYGNDLSMQGLLYGKMLRSPHAHARIRSIDASRALALPGVMAVITAADFPDISPRLSTTAGGIRMNYGFYSRNIMAREKALYCGHAVAAVAATSPHIAEEALSLIDVQYEVLPAVVTVQDSMKEDAPILHEQLITVEDFGFFAGAYGDEEPEKGTNIANHSEIQKGDVEEGFREADIIVEREFHTKRVHQGYIEPHAAAAQWNMDGTVTIWSSTQGHFMVRDNTAAVLGVPVSKLKVVATEIGGGFGGKSVFGLYLEPVAAALSRKAGRPVKIAMSRTEVFTGTGPTSSSEMRVKMGATKDGRLTAAEAHLIYEAGAFPGSPVSGGARCMFSPYDIPNARVEGFDVLTSTPKVAAYRAPGAPIGAFAAEQVLDELAEKLQIDPIEFRLRNAAKEGTRQITGPMFGKIGYVETLLAAKEHPHFSAPQESPYRGRGIASGYWGNGTGPASAIVSVLPDGVVSLLEGAPDIGGSRVAMAMHVAEVLGIPPEDVKPAVADTDSIGYTTGASGSGVTHKAGTACYEAAVDVRRQMVDRAAAIWEVTPDIVEYRDGVLFHTGDPELKLTFKELAPRLNATGGPIVGRAGVNPQGVGNAFATHIVDVEVDPETGKVDILRYTCVQDVGKAIHPAYVEGQVQGGAVQGIGWALNEEYCFNQNGQMLNSSFLDYRMPTSLDLPMIDTVLVEVANPGHPFGARGVAELPIVPAMAAIANAVYRAIGVRIEGLPISPARVLEALEEKARNGKQAG